MALLMKMMVVLAAAVRFLLIKLGLSEQRASGTFPLSLLCTGESSVSAGEGSYLQAPSKRLVFLHLR